MEFQLLRRLRQEDQFEASLGNVERLHLTRKNKKIED
jgi:hypothetical protein